MFVVWSDSMSKTDFSAGDLIIVKETDTKQLQVGDIITFESTDPTSFGQTITHKIKAIQTDNRGTRTFTTYGTTTGDEDVVPVYESHIIGKYVGKIPSIGYFSDFLKKPVGYVTCILLPCVVLFTMQFINISGALSKKRAYEKAELESQRDELASQHQQIAAELEEAERLKKELEELKKKLSESNANDTTKNGN